MNWNTQCKFAPSDSLTKHCSRTNDGEISQDIREIRAKHGKGLVGKGMFGCARHCRYLEGLE